MPLFGKKKEAAGYPKQQQPSYPTQAQAPPPPVGGPPPAGGPPMYQQAPPAYSQYPSQAPPQGYAAAPPQGAYYQPPPPGGQPLGFQPGQNVVVQGGFDAGARFDGIAQPNVPPPPPGYGPNAAQMAAMSGANVQISQRPSDFFTGGSDGGYTMF